ncbi:leukocyte tyrosine kinase receptor-like [Branchiostoma floridae]|uniref:receptor protein-tyrosine kinase n=1 Tax=Branchiostoma floridae TaxID=7739 RepID=A0A9J7LS19_BRAFL|nr:leukocyte tyrosine kinase receptor-like [Branchiostoma floridae]
MNVYSDVTARLESLLKGPTPDISDDISYVRFDVKTERNSKEREIIFGDIVDSTFCTAKFTTLGTTGRLGPTTMGNHYRGQDHEHLVTLHDGIQHFTVPETGAFSIEVAGAAAGWGMYNPKSARGRGAMLNGTFTLKQGETLKILVGQEGAENKANWSVGGGGGTFVTRGDNKPLIIAGGGGGWFVLVGGIGYRPIIPSAMGLRPLLVTRAMEQLAAVEELTDRGQQKGRVTTWAVEGEGC